MASPNLTEVARHYFVNDIPGSTIPASRLRGILERLLEGSPLTTNGHNYLRQLGLTALEQLARGEITYEMFEETAAAEQAKREQIAKAEKEALRASIIAWDAQQQAREAAAQLEWEKDPKYIARTKNKALRARYDIELFIEQEHFSQLMNILRRLDGGQRLTDDDVLWLRTEGKDYFSETFQEAFHAREAAFFAGEYRRTSDPWNAVNASSHYRKCRQAQEAHDLLTSIPAQRQNASKLRSAIATTHGGVMRDLGHLESALNFGTQAHALTPKDFRPCTLLGAVNFELGNYDIGQDWYAKAAERGASERSIDQDLRSILLHADQVKWEEIKAFLLRDDPVRYSWVSNLHPHKSTSKGKSRDKPN